MARMTLRRSIEFVCLFLGVPLLLYALPALSQKIGAPFRPPIIPILIAMSGGALVYLLRATPFKRRDLTDLSTATRRDWAIMLGRFTLLATALTLALIWMKPEGLLRLPKTRPLLWMLVLILYPLLSVFPQGIIYRALYTHRYATDFPLAYRTVIGAAVFSFAHLPFANSYAITFTFVGGWLFLTSYTRTRSLFFSVIEHALYGNFLFTIGWGEFFFHAGTLRMLAQ